jgi:hypothetical protein
VHHFCAGWWQSLAAELHISRNTVTYRVQQGMRLSGYEPGTTPPSSPRRAVRRRLVGLSRDPSRPAPRVTGPGCAKAAAMPLRTPARDVHRLSALQPHGGLRFVGADWHSRRRELSLLSLRSVVGRAGHNRPIAEQIAAHEPGDTVTIESAAGFAPPRHALGTVGRLAGPYIVVTCQSPCG